MRLLLYCQKVKSIDELFYIKLLIDKAEGLGASIYFHHLLARDLEKFGQSVDQSQVISGFKDVQEGKFDAMVTLGGDGTILRAVMLIQDADVPILGVNLGRLGFLASVEKGIIEQAINDLIKGNYYVMNRSMLGLKCNNPVFSSFPYALNDFTVNKRDTSSMITIRAYVNGVLLNSYWADGLIISTPTGSTGYSLSCGGPIVFPDSSNFVITPVAPHNLNVRPTVISDDHHIRLEVEGRQDSFMCTLDSRYETITSKHIIEISKAPFPIKFIQLQDQSFMKTLADKLYWGQDKRN
jgi:NAD+ kinase